MSTMGDFIQISAPPGAPAFPNILINGWPEGGGYVRSEAMGQVELEGFSAYGTPQIIGPGHLEKYEWQIACHLSDEKARWLNAMIRWSHRTYKGLNNDGTPKAKGDGRLILRDGMEMIDSELSPHSRSLYESYSETWNASWVYGFADFSVLLTIPQEHKKHEGVNPAGNDLKLFTFMAQEV